MQGFPEDDDTFVVNFYMPGMTACSENDSLIPKDGNAYDGMEGEWKLRFPVTADRSHNEIIEINKEDKGITLRNLVKTRVAIITDMAVALSTEGDSDVYEENIAVSLMDNKEDYVPHIHSGVQYDDDCNVYYDMYVYDGQTDFDVSVVIPGTGDNPPSEIPITEFDVKLP